MTFGMGFSGSCMICRAAHADGERRPNVSRRAFLAAAAGAPALAVGGSLLAAGAASAQETPRDLPVGTFGLEPDWTLIWNGTGLELADDATVVVKDGVIDEIRRGSAASNLTKRRLAGQLLLPGFISGHTHVAGGSATRGIIEGGRSYARPLELMETLDDDELDALTAYNLAELLLSGCTTQVEMSFNVAQAKSYARVAKRWGARGYVGAMIPGTARLFPIWFRKEDQVLTDSVAGTLQEIADNLAFGRELKSSAGPLVQPMMSPHATDTHTPETMKALYEAAKELGTGLHIHLSQSPRETATVKRLWGVTPTQWLEQLGFFEMPVFGAHMTGVEAGTDFEILKKHGAVYAHCPSGGGAGGGGGIQPYVEALAAGVRTNIGIDTHSNDYVENMKLAVLLGRTRGRMLQAGGSKDLKLPTMWSALEGATINAAEGLRRKDLGRIGAGARADLVSVDVSGFLVGDGVKPPEPINHLLYANGTAVRDVLIDGAFKVADGKFVVDDQVEIAKKGGAVVQKLWKRLGDEGWFTDTPR